MIFRHLYRRKLLRLFGPFMDASGMAFLEKQVAEISEWRALKSFLPMRWFHSQDEITDALSKVARKHDERGGDWEWAATVALAATVEDDDLLCLPEGGPNLRANLQTDSGVRLLVEIGLRVLNEAGHTIGSRMELWRE